MRYRRVTHVDHFCFTRMCYNGGKWIARFWLDYRTNGLCFLLPARKPGLFNFATLEIMRGNLENDSWLGLADVKESSFFFLLCQRKVIVTTYKGKCIADVLFLISPTKWRNNHILGIRNINICKMRKEQVHQPIQH